MKSFQVVVSLLSFIAIGTLYPAQIHQDRTKTTIVKGEVMRCDGRVSEENGELLCNGKRMQATPLTAEEQRVLEQQTEEVEDYIEQQGEQAQSYVQEQIQQVKKYAQKQLQQVRRGVRNIKAGFDRTRTVRVNNDSVEMNGQILPSCKGVLFVGDEEVLCDGKKVAPSNANKGKTMRRNTKKSFSKY